MGKKETISSRHFSSRVLENTLSLRLFKNAQMQGAQILRNEAYFAYAAVTKDAAQRSR
jgi:hypothetical protein